MENTNLTITVKDVSSVEKHVQITIPADKICRELDKYYRDLRKSVKIKGFRPGRVPRSILERFYKKQVENEVLTQLMNETFQQAIKEKNIQPVSQPIIDNDKLEVGKDFTYSARVEVYPRIDLEIDFTELEVEQEKLYVTEADVDKYLEEIRNYHAQLKNVEDDRPIRPGDFVLIDFTGELEGVPFKERVVKDKLIEVKPDAFLPGFTNHLIGLRKGITREIKVVIPEDYEQKEIAGKTFTFQVTVKEIKEKVIPSLDDNFARDVGEFESLSELKEKVREEVTSREKQRIQHELHNSIVQKILENNPFDVPSSLVEKQIDYLIEQARMQLKSRGIQIDPAGMVNREIREAYRPVAEFQIKRSLLLREIAKREGIEVEPAEIKEYMKKIAPSSRQNLNGITGDLSKEEANERIKSKILEEKALAFLTEKAKIKMVEKPQ
ncbi:MAG: trigger factor [Deltaproteobacteria bacterium]|nr:MAG: trigger factor [Deltaproteobacteria bacterium]